MIDFYYLSGSPFTWRVWLALEHKALQYKRIELSLERGDLKADSYLALNPRGKVPVLVDEDFSIYESSVILEYLEDKYPDVGANLFPQDIQSRTLSRRLINEIDCYLWPVGMRLLMATFFTPKEKWDETKISHALAGVLAELERFEDYFSHNVGNEALTSVEYSMFPIVALIFRIEERKKDLGFSQAVSPELVRWFDALNGLSIFQSTRPPHWS
jgi:glutathione S-transferase